nr:putative ribonuclease H-like domain-containing protein [Tanacetum cinerariifolium]
MYCLVVTDDFSRFSWVFFLATKDETSKILKIFITGVENLIDLKVKVIRCDNGTEFKNRVMNQFYEMKGKFDRKDHEGFLIGYSTNSKPLRVFNSRTRIVEENLHVKFSENTPNIAESRPNWLFDIDALTKSMNYKPIVTGNESNSSAGKARVETVPDKDYILLPLWTLDPLFSFSFKDSPSAGYKPSGEEEKKNVEDPENEDSEVPIIEEPVKSSIKLPDDPNMPELEDISIFKDSNTDVFGFEDLDFPDKVYKVEKALYGLHQAPRAWYETLLTYLLDNGFQRGLIDKTLFIKRNKTPRPKRQLNVTADAPKAAEDAPTVDAGAQADPAPSIVGLHGDVDRSITDQGRFITWMVSCMTQLMDASGCTYQAFDSTLVGCNTVYPWVWDTTY